MKKIYRTARLILDAMFSSQTPRDQHTRIVQWFLRFRDDDSVRRALEDKWKDEVAASGRTSVEGDPAWERTRVALGFPEDDAARRAEYRRDLTARVARRQARTIRRKAAWRVAAVVLPAAVVIGSILMVGNWRGSNDPVRIVVAAADVEQSLTLPDNSMVRVMPGGRLSHAADFEDGRRVKLDGEAYFCVERDTARVFTVETEYMEIKVLGTDFHVHSPAGEQYSTVDLYHGSVSVLAGGRSVIMSPGEHLHYDHVTKDVAVTGIPIHERVYDRMPDLVFDGASLDEIFYTLRNRYGVAIEVMEGVPTGDRDIVADFSHVRSVDEVMRLLSMASGEFAYRITDTAIVINPIK